jgi:hypothetical protein
MSNWLLTLPRPPRQFWSDRARELENWSAAELYASRRFAQATPETAPWPEPPLVPRANVTDDPFERAAIRLRRPTPRRSPMGPPFLNEPPQDYPSYLGPVPRAPEWEQVVPGPTPWSPLAAPPRATDWGKVLTGIECRRTEDGRYINCITPGGRRFNVPAEGFPDYIGPGQPNYHYYNLPVGGAPVDPSELMQGVIDYPTPAPLGSTSDAGGDHQ